MNPAAGESPASLRLQPDCGLALIVEDDRAARAVLTNHLAELGFGLLFAENGAQAIDLLENNSASIAFVKPRLPDMSGSDLVRYIRARSFDVYLPVMMLVSDSDDGGLDECFAAGADDLLLYQHTRAEIDARIRVMDQLGELRNLYKNSIHEQVVARKILSVALSARSCDVDGMQVFSRSAAIFSGDLVLSARNPNGGLNILLADFTGHGLSAAVGVLPVADMFGVMTEKGIRPEVILRNINTKLYTLLPSGMFMAACMVEINSSLRSASVLNSGMPDIYLLDGNSHRIRQRISSTHIPLGIRDEQDDRFEFVELDIDPGDHFVLCTDGLTDAIDVSGTMFGTERLERLLEDHAGADVFQAIVEEFNQRTANRTLSDDVTLVALLCGDNLAQHDRNDPVKQLATSRDRGGWRTIDSSPVVLVVDDEELNLELISEYLRETEIQPVVVESGEQAMDALRDSPDLFSAGLLDRMLPGLDGLQVLSQIKSDQRLSMLPVIMQTASDSKQSMLEGLQAGAYYYLTKPYDRQTLLAIVRTAVNDYRSYRKLQENVKQTATTLKMMNRGRFTFRTLEEGRSLAALLAHVCDNPDHVVLGLTELMVNAVEHGNLGIGYEEKSRLNAAGDWEAEIVSRLNRPEHANKQVIVEFERDENTVVFAILDEGDGFEWQRYIEISPDRALDSHGRGIAVANSVSFDRIEYRGNGNQVCVTVVNQERT